MTVNITKPATNLAEKLAEQNKPTGAAGEALLRADTAQQQQANALGQYGAMVSTPMDAMRDYYNRVGVPLQQQAQAERDMSREIFDYQQMAPWEALRMYQGLISGNMGGMSTTTERGKTVQNR